MHRLALILALALLATGAPALAYTIYFKDGSRIEAREKYRVEGEKAYILMVNGTLVAHDASSIDVERTNAANTSDFGSAVLFEDGKAKQAPPPPPPRKPSLSDLIENRGAELRNPEQSVRAQRQPPSGASGVTDLASLDRELLPDRQLASDLEQYFRSQGIDGAGVFQGSAPGRPLIQISTNSEASVFRAITVACNALLEMRGRRGDSLARLDLLLKASPTSRAGQFSLDPKKAKELVDGRIDVTRFFVKYVEF